MRSGRHMFACIHASTDPAALLECARSFSPLVERTADDTVVLDASGLEQLFGSPRELANAIAHRAAELGFEARITIASNPDAAVHGARGFAGISIIPQGDEAKYLGSLPLRLLEPSPEARETLERWGIRTFRDLAALPETGVAARLGEEGVRLRKLARGEGGRPLTHVDPPPRFEEELELEYPVEMLEPLSFILARLLNQLCAALEARALAALELRLELGLDGGGRHERRLRLPVPMRRTAVLLKLLQLDLEAHPPSAPVLRVRILAEAAKPRVEQNGLYIPLAPEPEKLELTLARIAKIVGKGNAGSPELLDTHRPGAFRMLPFGAGQAKPPASPASLALRAFRPALAAKIETESGRPLSILAPGIRGKIVARGGPWRTSGDWWTREPWNRDEWDIALDNGALYRICCDHETGRWLVEGSHD